MVQERQGRRSVREKGEEDKVEREGRGGKGGTRIEGWARFVPVGVSNQDKRPKRVGPRCDISSRFNRD